jgi:hypothetical protein
MDFQAPLNMQAMQFSCLETLRPLRYHSKPLNRAILGCDHVKKFSQRSHPDNVLTITLVGLVKHPRFERSLNQAGTNNGIESALVMP